MRITVIGGGHGSYAAAADFALAGHEVTLWRRNGAALAPLLDDLRIHVTDAAGEHAAILAAVSDDLAHAVAGAALIVAPIPAFGHEELAATLAPHLHDGQVVLLPPGAFGTYLLARAAKGKPGVAYAETGTLPYLARKTSETAVRITERTVRLPTGVFPARLTEMAAPVLREVYPRTEIVVDAMDGALLNAGPIVH